MINVMIADDSYLIRAGILKLLSLDKELNILGDYENGADLLEAVHKNPAVDVVILDIDMPYLNGIQTATELRNSFPQIKIIILTVFDDDKNIFSGLNLQVDAYLLKDSSYNKITSSIHAVIENGMVYDPYVLAKIVKTYQPASIKSENDSLDPLSKREKTIAQLIHSGLSNHDIADKLYITEGTVKNDVTKIYRKLGIKRRTQLNAFFT